MIIGAGELLFFCQKNSHNKNTPVPKISNPTKMMIVFFICVYKGLKGLKC